MIGFFFLPLTGVHCHIGSLEKDKTLSDEFLYVHCHIGSLEIMLLGNYIDNCVHCHIGSLEI